MNHTLKIYLTSAGDGHYCGRSGRGSALANPFQLRGSTRKAVVQGYRKYLYLVTMRDHLPGDAATMIARADALQIATTWKIPKRDEVMAELTDMRQTLLQTGSLRCRCHCYKAPMLWQGEYLNHCHTEAIASYLLSTIK